MATPPRAEGVRTDEDLVAAVRLGDDRAFEVLWQRYHRRIAAYVNGMVNDHARAEDITQDVFMSALRRMRETDRSINFKPWIYEIAKNACIDAFRRSRRGEEVSYDADAGLGHADQAKLVSSSPTPDVAVDTRMSLDDLRGAFGGLSETHHDILVMRELEGLSYREIGERMGMSRPSVESTLFRARRRLTEEYEELVSGERCRRIQGILVQATGAAIGTRDTRRLAKHVSHCQPCRRQAALAGVDLATIAPRTLPQKVAALLPIPAFLRKRFGGSGGDSATAVAATQGHTAQWAASLVTQYVEPATLSGWAKAAAAAATIAAAGVGAGVATTTVRDGFNGRDEGSGTDIGARSAKGVSASAAAAAARARAAGPSAASLSPDGSAAAIAARDGSPSAGGSRGGSTPGTAGGSRSGSAAGGSGSGTSTPAGAPGAGQGTTARPNPAGRPDSGLLPGLGAGDPADGSGTTPAGNGPSAPSQDSSRLGDLLPSGPPSPSGGGTPDTPEPGPAPQPEPIQAPTSGVDTGAVTGAASGATGAAASGASSASGTAGAAGSTAGDATSGAGAAAGTAGTTATGAAAGAVSVITGG